MQKYSFVLPLKRALRATHQLKRFPIRLLFPIKPSNLRFSINPTTPFPPRTAKTSASQILGSHSPFRLSSFGHGLIDRKSTLDTKSAKIQPCSPYETHSKTHHFHPHLPEQRPSQIPTPQTHLPNPAHLHILMSATLSRDPTGTRLTHLPGSRPSRRCAKKAVMSSSRTSRPDSAKGRRYSMRSSLCRRFERFFVSVGLGE